MIAALELDMPGFAQYPIEIFDTKLSLTNGSVTSLVKGEAQKLPITCHPRDSVVHLYSISPDVPASGQGSANASHSLEVTVSVRAHVSKVCNPRISIYFKAGVDFSGSPRATQGSNQRNDKGANQSTTLTDGVSQGHTPAALHRDQMLSDQDRMGILFQFNAPRDVHVGKPFRWEIFVVNRSSRQRKLALTMLSKYRSAGEKRISGQPSSMNTSTAGKTISIADAFVDDNLLYAKIKSQAVEPVQLICLSSDLRVG